MKLYTDNENLQSIKIIAASEIAKVVLEVEIVQDTRVVPFFSESRLPVLEVSPNSFLFSANVASSYLLRKSGLSDDTAFVDQWLEWESAELQRALVPYLLSRRTSENVDCELVEHLDKHLKVLETKLNGKEFIVEEHFSAADLVLWGAVYPLFSDNTALKDASSNYPSIHKWFAKMNSRKECNVAVDRVLKGIDLQSLKTTLPSVVTSAGDCVMQNVPPSKQPKDTAPPRSSGNAIQAVFSEKAATEDEIFQSTDAWNTGRENHPKPHIITHPILPKPDVRNILITSALPYVNNVPHLGNIIGCVLSADVFARFCRLRNYNTLYICGTDEYGTATETKAVEEGLTPQQICDKYNVIHTAVYKWFNIDFDYFGRTSTEQQTQISQDIFWRLYEKGFILKESVDQLLCEKCQRFLADRFVEGICPFCAYEDARGDQCDKCGKLINAVELKQPRCKICASAPVLRSSKHLFLDLPNIEPLLNEHLEKVFKSGTWTLNARTITNSWIRDGLKPRCISRDLKWGTPVPLEGYTDKVFYVWFDAPIGYLSITANYTDQWALWWKNPQEVELYNFLGKDNVPFHSVIFPCTLLGANDGYTVVNHLVATEYLNYEDSKFSKSRGVGIFGHDAVDTGIPADIYRFYLLYLRPESQDSAFSWDDFLLKNNSELLNNLGNFINRGLMFVKNSFGGVIQEMKLTALEHELLALIHRELQIYVDNMEQARLRDSLRNILSISRYGNQYMQHMKPWVLVKGTDNQKEVAGSVVSLVANIACLLSVLLKPYMPETSDIIQQQLNAPAECNMIAGRFVPFLPAGHIIGQVSPLFKKIEASTIVELKKRFMGKGDSATKPTNKANNVDRAQATPLQATGPIDSKEVERLTAAVSEQGLKVRDLKSAKAEASAVDVEVKHLLELKKQLALAQGIGPEEVTGGKKKKKGKK